MDNAQEDLSEHEVAEIRRQVRHIIASEVFAKSRRLQGFLSYVVEESLAGRGERLNQHDIAQRVFERDESFDPTVDAIVRVEAGRLRTKLREYYLDERPGDGPVITLQRGSYRARFDLGAGQERGLDEAAAASGDAATPSPSRVVPGRTAVNEEPVVVVLPFLNLSSDEEYEYLADGICEDLITDLSALSGVKVIARQSSFAYRGSGLRIQDIAAQLRADYVVEGSVRKAGAHLRINVQLIDATSETHLWAVRKDIPLEDVFVVQEEINQAIAAELKLTIAPGARPPTTNVEAYDYVLLGMKEARRYTDEGIQRSNYCFRRAIDLDEDYAEAIARLSFNHVFRWISGWEKSFTDTVHEGVRLARQASEIGRGSALCQTSLSWSLMWSGQHDEAIAVARLALDLGRSSVDTLERTSLLYSWSRSFTEAGRLLEQAIRLNPLEPYNFQWAMIHFMQGDYGAAIPLLEASLDRNPRFLPSLLYLGASFGLTGQLQARRDVAAEIAANSPDYRLEDERYLAIRFSEDRDRFVRGLKAIGLK